MRRRASTTARSNSVFTRGAKISSPASMAYWQSRNWCARTGSAAVADDVNDHLLVLEHPVPVGAAIDAHRRLVGADDARTAQSGQDRRDLVVEAGLGA